MYMNMYQGAMESDRLAYGWNIPLSQVYGYDPYPAQILPEKRHLIWGVQANMWTEYAYGPEDVEYQLFPRTLALAELAWSLPANKDFGRFPAAWRTSTCGWTCMGSTTTFRCPKGWHVPTCASSTPSRCG